jgi:hypothetical protein
MKRTLLSLVVAGAALLGASQSWAATVTVGLGPLPGASNPVTDEQKLADASGTIDYTFSLAQASQIQVLSGGPVSGIAAEGSTGISGLSLKLLDNTNTVIATAGSVSAFGQLFTGLTSIFGAGSYTLEILFTKNAAKTLADITTTVTTNLASTPIPASGLLLLTALGGLGFAGYRRRQNAV